VCHCQRLNRNQGLCNPPGQAENKRRNGNNGKWQKRGKNQEASKTKAGKIANKQKKKTKNDFISQFRQLAVVIDILIG